MDRLRRSKIMRPLVIALLTLLLLLSATGTGDRLIGRAGLDTLARSNRTYLDASFDRALRGFILLSGLKMGLAVIKDSEAGISLGVSTQLHIGGLAQAAYDYVDLAWKTLLAGCGVLLGMGYLLDAVALADGPALTVTLALLLLLCLARWYLPQARRTGRFLADAGTVMMLVTLSLYLLLPLSIRGGAYLSTAITAPAIAEAEGGMTELKGQLFPQGIPSNEGIYERLKGAAEWIDEVTTYLKIKGRAISVWVIKLITGYVFDCVLFPLLLFILLYKGVRVAGSYLFALRREEALHRALEERGRPAGKWGEDA